MKDPMEMKEFLKLFFSFFLEKSFIFGVFYSVGFYTLLYLYWWLG